MFTIMTYCGQKNFLIPIMGYINLIVYLQQKIDIIFWKVEAWV